MTISLKTWLAVFFLFFIETVDASFNSLSTKTSGYFKERHTRGVILFSAVSVDPCNVAAVVISRVSKRLDVPKTSRTVLACESSFSI